MPPAGGQCERFASLQDIYPTLAELCGIEPPDYLDGRSMRRLMKDPKAEWESTVFRSFKDRSVTIRTENIRYTRYQDDQQLFYDCRSNPREWGNLIGEPLYASQIESYRLKVPRPEDMVPVAKRKRSQSFSK